MTLSRYMGIRRVVFTLMTLFVAVFTLWANEVLPVLKVGQDVYHNVTITSVTPTDIYFTSSKGMGNAKLKNLDADLQKHFKFDAVKVAETEKKLKLASAPFSLTSPPANLAPDFAVDNSNAKTVMDDAMNRVRTIVNQPVTCLPETTDMQQIGYYPDGWFHPGANVPEYAGVDIHTTQSLPYKNKYVSSSLNKGVVFLGEELEFNANTKYFYTDRNVPKKKLAEPEMVEINRLYRIVANCQNVLAHPPVAADPVSIASAPQLAQLLRRTDLLSPASLLAHRNLILAVAAAAVVLLASLRFLTKKQAQ